MSIELTEKLLHNKQEILNQLQQEQLLDNTFSDLYIERVVILLRAGKIKLINAAQWIQLVIDAQLPNGLWNDYLMNLSFDGESITGKPGAQHTSVLSLLALKTYLTITESGIENITGSN